VEGGGLRSRSVARPSRAGALPRLQPRDDVDGFVPGLAPDELVERPFACVRELFERGTSDRSSDCGISPSIASPCVMILSEI
jgi:hypothetical protein